MPGDIRFAALASRLLNSSHVSAPLRPFIYHGVGSVGVTAKAATLVDAANILGR